MVSWKLCVFRFQMILLWWFLFWASLLVSMQSMALVMSYSVLLVLSAYLVFLQTKCNDRQRTQQWFANKEQLNKNLWHKVLLGDNGKTVIQGSALVSRLGAWRLRPTASATAFIPIILVSVWTWPMIIWEPVVPSSRYRVNFGGKMSRFHEVYPLIWFDWLE